MAARWEQISAIVDHILRPESLGLPYGKGAFGQDIGSTMEKVISAAVKVWILLPCDWKFWFSNSVYCCQKMKDYLNSQNIVSNIGCSIIIRVQLLAVGLILFSSLRWMSLCYFWI